MPDYPFGNFNYQWVNHAPVEPVSAIVFDGLVRQLSEMAQGYDNDGAVLETGRATTFGQKATACQSICKQIREFIMKKVMKDKEGNFEYFAYRVSGMPVALMLVRPGCDPEFVEYIVSHPAADSGGTIMVEFAVGLSRERGKQGRIGLDATKSAKPFYVNKCGFTLKPEGEEHELVLNPAMSPMWTQVGGRWRLVSERAKGDQFLQTTPVG